MTPLPRCAIVDTHAFIWFIEDNPLLSPRARSLMQDPEYDMRFSIAGAWEMTIKAAQGKLDLGQPLTTLIPNQLALNHFSIQPIELRHLAVLGTLPLHHRDPFDRILIAQGISEGIPVVSGDSAFEAYTASGLMLIW